MAVLNVIFSCKAIPTDIKENRRIQKAIKVKIKAPKRTPKREIPINEKK